MMRRSLAVLAVLLLALIAVAVWGVREHRRGPGARRVVVEYLKAVERRDRTAVLTFAPPGYDAVSDVQDRLRRFGGARADQAEILITTVTDLAGRHLTPEVLIVRISTVGMDSRRLSWIENMIWKDGAWRLLLGRSPDAGLGPPPSNTEYPPGYPARRQ